MTRDEIKKQYAKVCQIEEAETGEMIKMSVIEYLQAIINQKL